MYLFNINFMSERRFDSTSRTTLWLTERVAILLVYFTRIWLGEFLQPITSHTLHPQYSCGSRVAHNSHGWHWGKGDHLLGDCFEMSVTLLLTLSPQWLKYLKTSPGCKFRNLGKNINLTWIPCSLASAKPTFDRIVVRGRFVIAGAGKRWMPSWFRLSTVHASLVQEKLQEIQPYLVCLIHRLQSSPQGSQETHRH